MISIRAAFRTLRRGVYGFYTTYTIFLTRTKAFYVLLLSPKPFRVVVRRNHDPSSSSSDGRNHVVFFLWVYFFSMYIYYIYTHNILCYYFISTPRPLIALHSVLPVINV